MSPHDEAGSSLARTLGAPARLLGRKFRAHSLHSRPAIVLVVAALLVLFPLLASRYALDVSIVILVYGVFAMSLDLLIGYAGLPSFGHAAFFGIGAYAAALVALHVSASLWLTLGTAVAIAALAALLIGVLSIRVDGLYFVMLTLALSQLVYAYALSAAEFAGGSNGLPGVPRPTLAPLPALVSFWDRKSLYYLTLVFFALAFAFLRSVVLSPFGRALVGVRENERRMRALGYETWMYKLGGFVIAGGIAGGAGALYVYQRGFVSPEVLYWTTSGLGALMVIVGGAGTLIGPAVGAALYVILQDVASSYTEWWQFILGIIFIFVVYFMRRGVAGFVGQYIAVRSGPVTDDGPPGGD
jgi:branched-chain amino acid transport system permease protein